MRGKLLIAGLIAALASVGSAKSADLNLNGNVNLVNQVLPKGRHLSDKSLMAIERVSLGNGDVNVGVSVLANYSIRDSDFSLGIVSPDVRFKLKGANVRLAYNDISLPLKDVNLEEVDCSVSYPIALEHVTLTPALRVIDDLEKRTHVQSSVNGGFEVLGQNVNVGVSAMYEHNEDGEGGFTQGTINVKAPFKIGNAIVTPSVSYQEPLGAMSKSFDRKFTGGVSISGGV
jgi:hypothetical protein